MTTVQYPTGSGKNESDKCQYFVVNSTTYTYAIVQSKYYHTLLSISWVRGID